MTIPIERVRTDGFEMECFRFGAGRRPLVILPGLSVKSVMASAQSVAGQYRGFTRDFTVWVFDRRLAPPQALSIRQMAADQAAAMRALGLSDACLFGASQGGMVAMQLAVDAPELVGKLALSATAARVRPESGAVLERWVRLAREKDREGLYLAFGEAIYPPDIFSAARELLLTLAQDVTDDDLERFVLLSAGSRDFDLLDRLTEIRCPVLVTGSRDDGVLGVESTEQIAEQLADRPDFTCHLYDGCGHAVYDTAPDHPDRLLRFFTGLPPVD